LATRRTLLLVEDDAPLRELYRLALTVAGYDVKEASDGWEALRRIDSVQPDLIVLDLGLPMVSGEHVLMDLSGQPHLRHIPVVVVTGSSDSLGAFKVACVLRKPTSPDDLVGTVRSLLAGRPEQS
jgi:DNA-binding response OmpR family regulator